jgi:thiamine biosynthesis protein ThiS
MSASLMLVTDSRRAPLPLPELAESAVAGGVDVIQIREKDLSESDLLNLAASVVDRVGTGRVLVNGSVIVAKELGTGLHLPESSIETAEARCELGAATRIGRSVHSSALDPAHLDYLIAGHVFATARKSGLPPIGLNGFGQIARATTLPVYAIGGITPENARSCIAAGAHGIAVMSAINNSNDPAATARTFRVALDRETESTMATVTVTINGKPVEVENDLTIKQFLDGKGYHDRLVVVELNEKILQRSSLAETVFHDGDRVEIVHFVGGG